MMLEKTRYLMYLDEEKAREKREQEGRRQAGMRNIY